MDTDEYIESIDDDDYSDEENNGSDEDGAVGLDNSSPQHGSSGFTQRGNSELKESDIFDTEPNPEFVQPVEQKPKTDYLKICDDLLKIADRLKQKQYENSSAESAEIDTLVEGLTAVKQKLNQIVSYGRTFNKRCLMISSFANTEKNFTGMKPSSGGEYDRKCIESIYSLEDLFSDESFGNPIGTVIDFIFDDSDSDVLILVNKLLETVNRPREERLVFGSYRLDKIYKNDRVIKEGIRYTMIFTDIDTGVSFRGHISNVGLPVDIRIDRVGHLDKNIFDAIPDMILRRVVHPMNITNYIRKLIDELDINARINIWMVILRAFTRTEVFESGIQIHRYRRK